MGYIENANAYIADFHARLMARGQPNISEDQFGELKDGIRKEPPPSTSPKPAREPKPTREPQAAPKPKVTTTAGASPKPPAPTKPSGPDKSGIREL